MRVFFYDRSFEGLLSVVFAAYSLRCFPDYLLENGDIPPLTTTMTQHVVTQTERSDRVTVALQKKLSPLAFRDVLYVWLSEQEGSDMLLFRVICKFIDAPHSIENNETDEDIRAFRALARTVRHEVQQLVGFARFQKTKDDIYCAVLAPRYAILPFLLPHFAKRFGNQRWMLYDTERGYGLLYAKDGYKEVFLEQGVLQKAAITKEWLDADEALVQRAWQEYCGAATIAERKNLKLQRRCMPRRFWPYMVETQGRCRGK